MYMYAEMIIIALFLTSPVNAQITNEPPMESVDVCELISRIQEHVLVNRIRVCEHFQDFDPLRSGSISAARFRQVTY